MVVCALRALQILVASVCLRLSSRAFSNCSNHSSTCRWSALRRAMASWVFGAMLRLLFAFDLDFDLAMIASSGEAHILGESHGGEYRRSSEDACVFAHRCCEPFLIGVAVLRPTDASRAGLLNEPMAR